jgi:O-antigen/teichoic acid export membrane protein
MFKKIFVSFSLYTVTSIICALLSMLILPVLTRHLSQRDYGLTALFSTFIAILSPIMGLSSGSYFWLEFFKKDQSKINLTDLFSTYFWFVCGFCIFLLLVFFSSFHLLEKLSDFNLFFILLMPAASLILTIGDETKNYFINNKQPIYYMVYSVITTLLELGLSYYLVVYVLKNWQGRIFAWLISLFVQFLFTLWLFGIRKNFLRFTFSRSLLFKLVLFGYPLIFHQLGKFVINQSDRLFIMKMISIDEAGLYSIGYQVGSMILLPIAAFANFYTPFVYERLANIDMEKKIQIVKTSYVFIGLILLCYAAVVILSPYFFQVMIDKKFYKGLIYVWPVGLAYVFWGFYMMFCAVIFFKQKTKFLGWLSLLNVMLNAVLNYALIRRYGAMGAAYATTISFFVVFVFTAFYSHRLYPIPWFFFLQKNNAES